MGRNLSRILLRLTRGSRLDKLEELIENQYRPAEAIRQQQESKFLELIRHAEENSPYYRKILKNIKIEKLEDITRIPFLTKQKIHENIEEIKAQNLPEERFIHNSTGGSTGEKTVFYNDSSSHLSAYLMRGNRWAGWEVGDRQAQLWGAHYDVSKAKTFITGLKTSLIHRNIMMSSYDMTREDMLDYRDKINKYRPKLLTGYASALYLFSEFLKKNELTIHSPGGIISSAETLYPHQREKIESVFGCRVLNRYGCREVGSIAQECKEQIGLHIFSEHILLEVIDEKGRSCRPGETGEIVITELENYAFPFIRYRIGDLGVLSDRPCSCGRNLPLLEQIKGRVFDLIVGTNGNRLSGTFWTILLREYVDGIIRYQVIQEKPDELLLKLLVNERYSRDEEPVLIKKIKEKCGEDMSIHIEIVDALPLTESGKHRFIISTVSPFVE